MALGIAISNTKGVVTNYHRIIIATAVFTDGSLNGQHQINVTIGSYTDEAHRQMEKDGTTLDNMVVEQRTISLPFTTDGDKYSRQDLYSRLIAEVPDFSGAEEV